MIQLDLRSLLIADFQNGDLRPPAIFTTGRKPGNGAAMLQQRLPRAVNDSVRLRQNSWTVAVLLCKTDHHASLKTRRDSNVSDDPKSVPERL